MESYLPNYDDGGRSHRMASHSRILLVKSRVNLRCASDADSAPHLNAESWQKVTLECIWRKTRVWRPDRHFKIHSVDAIGKAKHAVSGETQK